MLLTNQVLKRRHPLLIARKDQLLLKGVSNYYYYHHHYQEPEPHPFLSGALCSTGWWWKGWGLLSERYIGLRMFLSTNLNCIGPAQSKVTLNRRMSILEIPIISVRISWSWNKFKLIRFVQFHPPHHACKGKGNQCRIVKALWSDQQRWQRKWQTWSCKQR